MRTGRWVAVALGLLALLFGAGRALAADHLVRITSTLSPASLTIAPGDTVTWRNDDTIRHRMRSTSGPGEFDSGDLDPGESFSVTLTALGTFAYRDDRDRELSNYWGTIIVAAPTPTGGSATAGPGATTAPGTVVHMAGRVFNPASITVPAGTSVRWLNDDSRDHTVTSSGGAFDSGIVGPGGSFVRTFSTQGTFPYLCAIHPDMTGVVNVLGSGGATPPPPPPPTAPVPTPPPPTGDVVIVDFAFTPADLTVDAGARLTFANRGAALHTVTATDGSFDSGLIRPSGTFQRVFDQPGTFSFLCALHPTMTGTIRVRGPNGATPPPAATPPPGPTAPPGGVRIVDFSFLPGDVRVRAGTTVTWVNAGVAPHTVTARDGSFNSSVLNPRATYSHTFSTPGTFAYLCAIHPDMTGTVLVEDGSGAVPPPSPAATGAPGPQPTAGDADVGIVDLAFEPETSIVEAGTTVRFTNHGAAIHTVTARDGSFDSGFLATGETFTRVFDAPGAFAYVCALHPSMTGTIVVTGAAAPAPSGTPTDPSVEGPGSGAGGGGAGGGGAGPDGLDVPAAGPGGPGVILTFAIVLLLCLVALGSYGLVLGDVIRRAER